MKIFKFLLSAVIILPLFTACSSDDDESSTPVDQDSLVGTWEMIALNADADFSGDVLGIPFSSSTSSMGENFDYTITFTETTYTAVGSYDIVTTGTLNGIPIDEDRETITDASASGTYEFINGELVFEGELVDLEEANEELEGVELDTDFEVTFNSNGELVVEQSGETSIEAEGTPLNVEYDSRIVFRRQ